jgi:hypothetical protein
MGNRFKGDIVMSNGVVLKNGRERFNADENLVKNSLEYVAKISQGLYSGSLNADPTFAKFQQEAMKNVIEKQKQSLCNDVVLGAEEQLQRISTDILAEKSANSYLYNRRSYGNVPEILVTSSEPVKDKTKPATGSMRTQELIEEEGNRLASFGDKEMEKIKEVNAEAKKVREIVAAQKKKKAKKKSKKKVSKRDKK